MIAGAALITVILLTLWMIGVILRRSKNDYSNDD